MDAVLNSPHLDEFIEKVPYGVTINRLDGCYVQVNQSFCDICEYSSEELLGMGFQDVTHPEDVKPNVELDEKLRKGEIPYYQMAKRYLTKSGLIKHVLLQVSLIRDDQGQPQYYYAQVIDVTDLGHLLDEKTPDREYLDLLIDIPTEHQHTNMTYEVLRLYRQQNLRKATHLGNIAHELKTPMTGVKGFASIMRKCFLKGDVEKAEEYFEKFNQSCVFLEHMVSELLDLTYIETGHLKPELTQFDVVGLMRNVVESMEPMADQHSLPLRLVLGGQSNLQITSDRDRLWEVLSNLISNGLKYTESGEVVVSLEAIDEQQLRIRVRDTGIGIRKEDLVAVFDEYQKVHKKLNKDVNSTGLGLPISRRLVTMLGGEITVISEEGKGSQFTVTLPITLSPEPP